MTTKSGHEADDWADLRAWVEQLRSTVKGRSGLAVLRFDRLMAYRNVSFENQKNLDKAWRAVCRWALDDDAAISVFLGLPDRLDVQPFTGLAHGRRSLDPASARTRNLEMAGYADKLLQFLATTPRADPLSQLLSDLDVGSDWGKRLPNSKDATEIHEHAPEALRLWQLRDGVRVKRELQWLSHALKGANPYKWYVTKQPGAADAGRQTCAALVADLTRHLSRPQPTALAVLGNANLPEAELTADQIRDAWRPPAWWQSIDSQLSTTKKKAG